MKIKEVTYQNRNDFYAILECEHCQAEQELKSGYDDDYYHNKVLPAIECKSCSQPRNPAPQPTNISTEEEK